MSFHSRRRPFAESKPEEKAGDGLWGAYLDAVDAEDKASVESWNGSTTGILTFAGLFAATVAAFVIESYHSLSPDTGAQTVALLAQLISKTDSTPVVPASDIIAEPFHAPGTAILVNSLWFLSLVIALICALLATLIQEWTRDYLRDVQHRTSDMTVKEYAFNHIYVRMGIERYGLDHMATLIVALMHIAVVLFLIGLIIFLFPIHILPAAVVTTAASMAALIYVSISVIPLFDNTCPYRTPLSSSFAIAHTFIRLSKLALIQPRKLIDLARTHPSYRTNEFWQLWKLPARRIYHDLPSKLRALYLDDRSIAQNTFMRQERMMFVWQRTSGYILSAHGLSALLEYLPSYLLNPVSTNPGTNLNPVSRDFDKFWVYLRSRRSFFASVVKNMTNVQSSMAGKGALRLLQLILHAESRVEIRWYSTSNLSASHLSWYHDGIEILAPIFPKLVRRFNTLYDISSEDEQLDMVVTLTSLRWSILQIATTRYSLWRSLLQDIDTIKCLRLLPLSREDRWISETDGNLKILSSSTTSEFIVLKDLQNEHLAPRNALTLLAHIIFSRWPLETPNIWRWIKPDHPYVKESWGGTWSWHKIHQPHPRSVARPHASALFLTVLESAGLGAWRDPASSTSAVPRGMQLHPFVVDALRNLLDLVSLPPLRDQVLLSDDEIKSLGLIIPHPNRPAHSDTIPTLPNHPPDTPQSRAFAEDTPEVRVDSSAPTASTPHSDGHYSAYDDVHDGSIPLHLVGVNSSLARSVDVPPTTLSPTLDSGSKQQSPSRLDHPLILLDASPSSPHAKSRRVSGLAPRGPRRSPSLAPQNTGDRPPSYGTAYFTSKEGVLDESDAPVLHNVTR
ncbi:unnamed protein product [Peniophora sp. CBMAI 1063]|nr:unnamed protein product [Peniophora sp. CBMAI 1063]